MRTWVTLQTGTRRGAILRKRCAPIDVNFDIAATLRFTVGINPQSSSTWAMAVPAPALGLQSWCPVPGDLAAISAEGSEVWHIPRHRAGWTPRCSSRALPDSTGAVRTFTCERWGLVLKLSMPPRGRRLLDEHEVLISGKRLCRKCYCWAALAPDATSHYMLKFR